jgi:hypothetical protein
MKDESQRKLKGWTRFGVVVAPAAFASVISFFQVGSAWSDAHNFNAGWIGIGIAAGIVALWQFYIVVKGSN